MHPISANIVRHRGTEVFNSSFIALRSIQRQEFERFDRDVLGMVSKSMESALHTNL